MQRAAALAVALSLTLAVLGFTAYSWLVDFAGRLGLYGSRFYNDTFVSKPRFELLYGIPVLVDKGTMTRVMFAAILSLLPLSLYAGRRFREIREYEEQLVSLLLTLPGMLAAAASTADALARAARVLRPPFSRVVEKAARLYRVTGDLEGALQQSLADDSVPGGVRVAASSIAVAAKAGGRVHEVFSRLASYLEASRRLVRIAEARLSEYKMIAVLAVLAYAATAGSTVALVSKASNVNLPGMTVRIDLGLLTGLFFYSLITVTAGSAMVIARVIYGYTPLAAKYMLLLLPAGYAAFIMAPLMV